LLRFFNDGQTDFIATVLPLTSSYTIVTTSEVYEYTLPTTFLQAYRVTYDGRALDETSLGGLDSDQTRWEDREGTPSSYFIRRTTQTIIGFSPTPVNGSTGTANIFFYVQSNALTGATSIPFNGFRELYSYHHLLSFYGAYRGWLILSETELANAYYNEYILGKQIAISVLNTSPNFKPQLRGDRGQ